MLKYSSLAIQAAKLCGCLAQRGNGASWQHEIHVGVCLFFCAFMQN